MLFFGFDLHVILVEVAMLRMIVLSRLTLKNERQKVTCTDW